ncbi:MAG: Fe-S cluster assembly protein SufB [Anaerolineae bacterium]|nr:Fe-S cluster assembly protein SufB [Anaerolineae bacterium]
MTTPVDLELDYSKYDFKDPEVYSFKSGKGLNRRVVEELSSMKGEPDWMLKKRLRALDHFEKRPMPQWGGDLSTLNFDDIHYYVRPGEEKATNWDDVPETIRNTYEKLGIPEAERKFLGGVGAQYESEVVYHSLQEKWQKLGVIFVDTDTAVKDYPDLVKQYFSTVIPANDNKFAALNTAVWSGGSFIYVPPGVHVDLPLQAYFRINAQNMGQFERTLIIVDEGASVHYIEGCTAPVYSSNSLHSAVVEIIVKPGGRCRYTTIQNWANNIYNLVTKRAVAYEESTVEWIDGNLGSRLTMKYPAVYLMGRKAKGETLSVAYAGPGQHQDAGAKMVHVAPETTSTILSKSISKGGGRTTYRGLAKVQKGAARSKMNVRCDALILDPASRSDTIPYIEIEEQDCLMSHEATVGKIGEDQLFYLQSRGLSENEAMSTIVLGFMEPFTKELPMEYAVELNRLIQMEMIGSVG